MLTTIDRQYIIEAIIEVLAPVDHPRQMLTSQFLDGNFPQMLNQGSAQEMLIHAVQLCEQDGWNNQPIWLERLLNTFGLIASNGKVKEIWERVKTPPPASVNPLFATVLKTNIPFVNRKNFRDQLAVLEGDESKVRPILIVNGKEKSGKSYSAEYVDHYCAIRSNITHYRISIEKGNELERGAEEIAKDLVSFMGASTSDIPKSTTNQKRFVSELAIWVLNKAVNQPGQHWFVLDNFSLATAPPDTKDFLIAFSDSITKGIFPKRCRLIIINFDSSGLSVDPGRLGEEIVETCTPAHVDAAILEITKGISQTISMEGMQAITAFVKDHLPNGTAKMTELNERLRALIIAIPGVKKITDANPDIGYEQVLLKMLADLPAGKPASVEIKKSLALLEESLQEL
jgi:hypothetical protein